MPIANQSAIADARTLYETLATNALSGARSSGVWSQIARWAPATGIAHETIIPGATPAWAEFAGTRIKKGFRKLTKTTGLKTYDKYLRIPRVSVAQDPDGSTAAAINNFTSDLGAVYDQLAMTALNANPTGADGVSLVNGTHPFGANGGTWSNSNTNALTFDQFNTSVELMMDLKDEFNEPLHLDPKVLIVSTSLRRTAREIVQAEDRPIAVGTAGAINSGGVGATGVTNVYKADNWTLVVTPRFASGNWVIVDPRFLPLKMCVWREPELVIVDDMTAHNRVENDEFIYGVEADLRADGEQPWGIAGRIQ